MNNNSNSYGTQRARKKVSKIEVSIEPEIKAEFMEMLHSEGRTASVQICEWIRGYIKDHREGLVK